MSLKLLKYDLENGASEEISFFYLDLVNEQGVMPKLQIKVYRDNREFFLNSRYELLFNDQIIFKGYLDSVDHINYDNNNAFLLQLSVKNNDLMKEKEQVLNSNAFDNRIVSKIDSIKNIENFLCFDRLGQTVLYGPKNSVEDNIKKLERYFHVSEKNIKFERLSKLVLYIHYFWTRQSDYLFKFNRNISNIPIEKVFALYEESDDLEEALLRNLKVKSRNIDIDSIDIDFNNLDTKYNEQENSHYISFSANIPVKQRMKINMEEVCTSNIILEEQVEEKDIEEKKHIFIDLGEYFSDIQTWESDIFYKVEDQISYGNQFYSCIKEHKSSNWLVDKDRYWKKIKIDEKFSLKFDRVFDSDYGISIYSNILKALKGYLNYRRYRYVTKFDMPIEELLNFDVGDKVILSEQSESYVDKWHLIYRDGKIFCSLRVLSADKLKDLRKTELAKYVDAEYFNEGYVMDCSIENGFCISEFNFENADVLNEERKKYLASFDLQDHSAKNKVSFKLKNKLIKQTNVVKNTVRMINE